MPPTLLVLGGSGYVGQAFVREIHRRGWQAQVVRRSDVDYTRFGALLELLRSRPWTLVVNCAGFRGRPNVDACEDRRAETILANTLLPQTVANACEVAGLPWGHVSSGCVFSGTKIRQPDGSLTTEIDLASPGVRRLLREEPHRVVGFTETDPPNFTFRAPPCSFYSGAKALGEEAILGAPKCYLWRLRIPFDHQDDPSNYLTKLQRYSTVYDNTNSISHLGDFARVSLELWSRRADFGIYNVTNPGYITGREVVELIRRHVAPNREFAFWDNDEEFYRVAARTFRSNCVLDSSKILSLGIPFRTVHEAVEDSLRHWTGPKAAATAASPAPNLSSVRSPNLVTTETP